MPPELNFENKQAIAISPEVKDAIRDFVDERYPENKHGLLTFKEIRENALAALENLGSHQEQDMDLLHLQQTLDLMAIYLRRLAVEKKNGQDLKNARYQQAYSALNAYINRRLNN
jgi:hypothetical protein